MAIFLIILKIIGIVLGSLIGLVFLEMVIAVFAPWISAPKQPLDIIQSKAESPVPPVFRETIAIKINDETISAYFYIPEKKVLPAPCIIMAHGFGGTKDIILEQYALRYREAGFATITFDYRHFGESDGQPRQYFSMKKQLEDLKAAISYARQRPEIIPEKIGLWGTSASGGYGIIIAAEDKQIACVVGQCPALDGKEDSRMAVERDGMGHYLRIFVHAQRDKGRSRFGMAPYTIPIVGKPGTVSILNAPGAFEGYSRIASISSAPLINEVCARLMLTHQGYNPVDYAAKVECPVLLHVCNKDNLASPKSHLKVTESLGSKAQVTIFPIGHFDIYEGEYFEKAISEQIAFFRNHF